MNHCQYGALVGHTALHPFGNQLLGAFFGVLKVAIRGPLLHGAERAHAAVGFVGTSLEQFDFARRLFGTCQQTAEHDAVGARGQRLGDVAGIADAAVGDHADAADAVAMLPPMTWTSGKFCFTHLTRSSTPLEWPCAVSTVITSTPAATNAATRSSVPSPVPTAAPTRRRPNASLHAIGCSLDFWISLTVISPRSSNASFTTNTRSRRNLCSSAIASSRLAPSCTVTSRSFGVMMLATGWSSRVSKRRSRLVTMPTTLPSSITGRPEIRFVRVMSRTWRTVICGATVMGSLTTPDSKRLTADTWAACISVFMFL